RGSRPRRLHLCPALRAAPGDQRELGRAARMRAGAQRQRGGRREPPRGGGGRGARGRVLGRPDPQAPLKAAAFEPPPLFVEAGSTSPKHALARHEEWVGSVRGSVIPFVNVEWEGS